MRIGATASAVLLAACLAGCGTEAAPEAAPEAASRPTAPTTTTSASSTLATSPAAQPSSAAPTKGAPRKYATPTAVLTDLARIGLPCPGFEAIEDPIGATGRGSCHVDDAEVVVSTYATHTAAENQWKTKSATLAGVTSVQMAIGVNWTLSGDPSAQDYLQRAALALGGDYRYQP